MTYYRFHTAAAGNNRYSLHGCISWKPTNRRKLENSTQKHTSSFQKKEIAIQQKKQKAKSVRFLILDFYLFSSSYWWCVSKEEEMNCEHLLSSLLVEDNVCPSLFLLNFACSLIFHFIRVFCGKVCARLVWQGKGTNWFTRQEQSTGNLCPAN